MDSATGVRSTLFGTLAEHVDGDTINQLLALCLRLAVALANHHRGNDVASPTITL